MDNIAGSTDIFPSLEPLVFVEGDILTPKIQQHDQQLQQHEVQQEENELSVEWEHFSKIQQELRTAVEHVHNKGRIRSLVFWVLLKSPYTINGDKIAWFGDNNDLFFLWYVVDVAVAICNVLSLIQLQQQTQKKIPASGEFFLHKVWEKGNLEKSIVCLTLQDNCFYISCL